MAERAESANNEVQFQLFELGRIQQKQGQHNNGSTGKAQPVEQKVRSSDLSVQHSPTTLGNIGTGHDRSRSRTRATSTDIYLLRRVDASNEGDGGPGQCMVGLQLEDGLAVDADLEQTGFVQPWQVKRARSRIDKPQSACNGQSGTAVQGVATAIGSARVDTKTDALRTGGADREFTGRTIMGVFFELEEVRLIAWLRKQIPENRFQVALGLLVKGKRHLGALGFSVDANTVDKVMQQCSPIPAS